MKKRLTQHYHISKPDNEIKILKHFDVYIKDNKKFLRYFL